MQIFQKRNKNISDKLQKAVFSKTAFFYKKILEKYNIFSVIINLNKKDKNKMIIICMQI